MRYACIAQHRDSYPLGLMQGVRVSGKRVGRLLRLEGLRGKRSRRFVVPPLGQNPPVPGGFHPYLRITP